VISYAAGWRKLVAPPVKREAPLDTVFQMGKSPPGEAHHPRIAVIPALFLAAVVLQADSARPTVRALRVADGAVTVDGALVEAAWGEAAPATGFRQREPDQGRAASDPTEVRVLYDGHALYVGIVARGADPVSRILQRDRVLVTDFMGRPRFGSDDALVVLLDTFHDHRSAILFATNANGAEFDALLTDEGREFNVDWRAVWSVRVARLPTGGWSAEFAIPFRTLRYPAGTGEQTWGFNVARITRRNNEETLWTAWSRHNGGMHRISQAGHLVGLERLPRSGLALEAKPYLLGSAAESTAVGSQLKAGLDLKWEARAGLTLDATANTDFAQVEADSEQVNLTRFDLFFPEKRDFFLENAGIFEFGMRAPGEPPPFLLFFSRRIGISDSGAVPLIGGARLTGRVGAQTLGLLDVVTDSVIDQQRSNYAVARIKRDVGASSYLGAMWTDVRRVGGYWNTVGGVDASWWPTSLLNLQGFYARTATAGPGGEGAAYRLAADYQADRFGIMAYTLGVGPEATADLGFITREDARRYETFGRVTPRPRALGIRKVDMFYAVNLVTRWDGGFQEWGTGPGFSLEWPSGEMLTLFGLTGRLRLDSAFDMSDSIPVDPGNYDNLMVGWFGNTALQRPVALSSSGSLLRSFGGSVSSVQASVVATPDPHLRLQLGGTRNWIRLPNGSLVADLASARVTLAFSTRVALDLLAQYNSLDRSVNANLRFNFIHRPGSDLYLVVNELRGSDTSVWGFNSRTAILKLTYLARF
jgi:hypothetical protein